ncbi:hypothetical protein Desor_3610 [Desulfosporosinus orientis DSM 765]|uniref:DUF4179 domain-containing protein n=1 Tax=Desulfosporosinus orientis (strain ATCC 19365 / DSM 765 / NCIMB 8382 / VKM B-1628 / Singapore I) TaxID=768706 RepID=G7WIL6_DESOD|nr:DUF4179 domain-containing protein [Desulfosporosinus orientis]AET69090.1 hypothetical protein Desor_3610 [Desulfosporosinus orientis DSM 765]
MFEENGNELRGADDMNDREDGAPADLAADLSKAKHQVIALPVPLELDEYINRGLTRGVKVQKSRRFRKWSMIAACFLLAVLMTSARVSPVIAEALQQIPGLGYIVELINYDKGLQSAVKNDFVLPLGVSDEHDGIVFTVDGMIMDEGSLILFYTLDYSGKGSPVQLSEVKLFDDQGESVQQVALGYSSMADAGEDGEHQVYSQITVNFNERTKIPPVISLKVKLSAAPQDRPPESFDQLSSTWELAIPVDKDLFAGMKKVYEINQSVVVEGQKITFEKLTIYPTRMALRVVFDPANSKKIFAFDDLALVNEQGEEWGRIANGMTGSKEDEYHETLFFQSNYFTQPQKLYLRGKSIRALDKDKTKLVFDLDQKKIIESPPGLKFYQVTDNLLENVAYMDFLLKLNPDLDKLRGYSVLSFEFTDKAGNSFSTKGQGFSTCSDAPGYDQTITISLPLDQDYQSPLTFQIQDYPIRITGKFDIRIK